MGKAPVAAEFHLVESASALHYGPEVEDDGEVRRGDCLLIRLGTNESGTTEDLPLPEDAPTRPGELLLLVSPQMAMDLGDAIRSALRAYLDATEDNVLRLSESRNVKAFGFRTTSYPSGDDGLGGMPRSRWLSAGLRRSRTTGCGLRVSERSGCRPFRGPPKRCRGCSTTVGSPGSGVHFGRYALPHGEEGCREGKALGRRRSGRSGAYTPARAALTGCGCLNHSASS